MASNKIAPAPSSVIYSLYRRGLRGADVLRVLSQHIRMGRLKPTFAAEEIKGLFCEQLIEFYSGIYTPNYDEKNDPVSRWIHLLNKFSAAAVMFGYDLENTPSIPSGTKNEYEAGLKQCLRKLQIIEDWLYYNPGGIPETVRPALLLKKDFPIENRPAVISSVLVVDDKIEILRLITKDILGDLNLDVTAVDPEKPIRQQIEALTPENFPDLIIMDYQLPGTNGAALTRLLRQNGFNGFIVANSSDETKSAEIIRAGADFKITGKNAFDLINFFES